MSDDADKRHRETFARLRARHQRQEQASAAERFRSAETIRRLVAAGIRPDRKSDEAGSVYRDLMNRGLRKKALPVPTLRTDSDDST